MRKSLFAIGLLAAINSVQAQNVLVHVDDAATTYVSKGTLVYSGGGLQMKGSGIVENHGNFMVDGTSTDSFKTIDASNVNKTEANGGGNFVNKLNEPTAYATYNTNSSSATPAYTYGQLFISGIPQTNITGIVDQEYRAVNHGTYQQIGLPFYDKTASTLSAELGKTFTNARYSKNEILAYSNPTVVSMNVDITTKLGVANPGTAYYMLGGLGLDVSNTTRTLKGRPLTDIGTTVTLQNAGNGINFGTGGSATNMYNEKYYTYLQDGFHIGSGGTAWQGNYGRNIYQFSNPFLTNIDLSQIAVNEGATVGDGINLTKIQGVRLEVSGVQTASSTGGSGGTGSSSYKFITYPSGVPTGDVDYTVVRPMGTFVIKLLDNTSADTFNFANLRRFNYYSRAASTNYSVAANKNSSGTVKQLGVIGLDANGNEVARTYYVVYPNGTTGHSTNALTQVTLSSGAILGTFEEDVNGGYDNNYTGQYWLYINEANEFNFKGKNIKLVNYDLNTIKSYKFEIRENAQLVADGTHALSTGIGFYYKAANGTLQQAIQGGVTSATNAEYDLYYGEPNVVLATTETKSPSRTVVIYNPAITNYIVRFDPNWKKADIEVYDMSGKLVISKKAVETTRDFVIELDQQIKNSYVVKIVSDKGDIVNTKILK
ncbi:T9SS type A sorting domain-containing protein [Chryseobacterium gambrini]|uniref:T9SS type A sorting domain-containing protein n=1 Tax=Chryseobacterium gambrini TaxID=373672 RepID=A0AAJ1VKN5_9FLAO|nr:MULTISPECIES: T9SS type A sorting domain-containing protein [Chryseobacterium]MDN4013833.1 T9SS type A sorting domain-containing protein [Chryseobacterium gambrini]MDN4031160.1 T9SS type A sorting domain-containing protein [Chryseobacterium gambrini]QWA37666.1 T9SS type A sorting domain-containing protein [Chryseobacterium sp. ZHDP1]